MKKTLVVNFYGGPGTGKSTTAAAIFAMLKNENINCEYVQEFAKEMVWDGILNSKSGLITELFIFGEQCRRLERVNNKVDVILTDSPLLQKLEYIDSNDYDFAKLILKCYHLFYNLDIFLKRTKKYNPKGRYQTEDEVKINDRHILQYCKTYSKNIFYAEGNSEYYKTIVDKIKENLK